MAKPQTYTWDIVEHLQTDEDIAAYLEAAQEAGDPALIAAVLEDITRAREVISSKGGSSPPTKMGRANGNDDLIPEVTETFTLRHEAEVALLSSIKELDRGEFASEAETVRALHKEGPVLFEVVARIDWL